MLNWGDQPILQKLDGTISQSESMGFIDAWADLPY
jgi:hypothetical protein